MLNGLFIDSGAGNGAHNMALDQTLLMEAIEKRLSAILRVYRWDPPCVSIGRHQTMLKTSLSSTLDVVKRPTGGRAVLHEGDVSYCFIVNALCLTEGASVQRSYREISRALINGLETIGVHGLYIADSGKAYTQSDACMAISTGADIEHEGQKVIGSAQFRKEGYILQHGSILVHPDFQKMAALLGISEEALHCASLETVLGYVPSYEALSKAIKVGFGSTLSIAWD